MMPCSLAIVAQLGVGSPLTQTCGKEWLQHFTCCDARPAQLARAPAVDRARQSDAPLTCAL